MDITILSPKDIEKLTPQQRQQVIDQIMAKRAAAQAVKQQTTPQTEPESPFTSSPQPLVLPKPEKPLQVHNPEYTGHLIRN